MGDHRDGIDSMSREATLAELNTPLMSASSSLH